MNLKKILFPFFKKENHYFLIKKWWFRMFVVLYVFLLIITFFISSSRYENLQTRKHCVSRFDYFSSVTNINKCSVPIKQKIFLLKIGISLFRILLIHYFIQLVFFKIVVDYIVLDLNSKKNKLKEAMEKQKN